MSFWDITATGILGMAKPIGEMLYSQFTGRQQFERQKQLMDLQMQNQKQLNTMGRDIQMDIWNKTNYEAQMAQLKAAGLNPSLMYAKGGIGGSTGSQSGGSAASGSVQQAPMIDLAALNFMKTQAEVELLKAQAQNQESQAEANRGYLKEQSEATTSNLKITYDLIGAEINTENAKKLNIEADTLLKNLDAYIKDKTKENQVAIVNEQLDQLKNINNKLAIEIMTGEKDLAKKDELLSQLITQNNLNIAMTGIEMEAVRKGMQLNDAQMKKIRNEIAQEWKKIDLQEDGLQLTKNGQQITLRGQTLDYNLGIFQGRVSERGQNMSFKMNKYQTDQYNQAATKIAHLNGLYGLGKEALSIAGDVYTIPMKGKK